MKESTLSVAMDNFSKYQWIFTKLGMCIDIMEIWFGIAYGQITSILADLSSHHMKMAGYYRFMFLFAVYIQFTEICFNKMQWSHYGIIQTPSPVIQSSQYEYTMRFNVRERTFLCASNKDSNQPAHPPYLIGVFIVRMKKPCVLSYTTTSL